MSGLGWKLKRLSAMSAGELVERVRVSARDRVMPPRWSRWTPAEASAHLHRRRDRHDESLGFELDRLHRWLSVPAPSGELEPVIASARALLEGRWELFGRAVTLADPPDWNRNPLTGAAWPDAPSRSLDSRRAGEAGGAKFTWELGRLTFLSDLALASRLTGDEALARRAAAWLLDFSRRNPLGHGIHQTSGIEMAIRVITASATLALLPPRASRDALESALGLIAQQALWCGSHLSRGSSANNHLIAEYVAMIVAGGTAPGMKHGAKLARAGLEGLEREIERQFHPDGVNAEQAFGYLPFVWELVLCGLAAADAAGLRLGDAPRARLAASLEFARSIRLPDGRTPQVGDEDDGRILLASHAASRLDLVGNALAAWLALDALAPQASAYASLLGADAEGAKRFEADGRHARGAGAVRIAADGRHEFPSGGWTIWRERGLLVTFDHGPLGLGSLAAHGHADALSVTLFRGRDGLVVDPGTLAYQEDAEARDRCRGTPAHATVNFGGRNQSEILGPFLWGRRAAVAPEGEGWRVVAYTGERHTRRVSVEGARLTIEDHVEGREPDAVFPLAPEARAEIEGDRVVVECGDSKATFEFEGFSPPRLETSEHSPRYSHRVAARRIVARLAGARGVTRITAGGR